MSVPDHDAPEETMWEGRFIAAKRRGRWEYVSRARGLRAAVILAIDEDPGGVRHVLLVDQYRVPLGRRCLELPAGLVGDEDADESVEDAAARELEEETGYRAARLESLGDFGSSPGMVSEYFTLIRATGLEKVTEGGGVEGEGITVHRVPLDDVASYVKERRAEGMAVDVRMLLILDAGMIAGS